MVDHPAAASPAADPPPPTKAAEQARLRKERREAKIKAGGSSRLNKITGMGGRVVGGTAQAVPTEVTPPASGAQTPDPEVDISQSDFSAATRARPRPRPRPRPEPAALPDAQLRQMMLGLDRPDSSRSPSPGAAPAAADDPLTAMMAQLMNASAGGPPPSFPGMPGAAGPSQSRLADGYNTSFRLLHAILALGLGLYIALLTPFSGTRTERERAAIALHEDTLEERKRFFFWAFATGEAVLLTTRLFLDKGRPPPSGMLWTAVSYVPEPFRSYLSVILRYGRLFRTVRADLLACMFVLGVCSWWKL